MSDIIDKQAAIETALDFFVEFLGGAFYENSQKELIARFQRLPSAQQWIPCSERLPKCPDRKQVQLSNGWIITAYFELGDWYAVPPMYDEDDIYVSLKEAGYRVIAWRELPEPWKGEQE